MKKNILVLGAGHVGSAIAIDLKNNGHNVFCMDLSPVSLEKLSGFSINTIQEDFTSKEALNKALHEMDLVIGAAPGNLGYALMQAVIEAGKNMVDISFCPEDYMELDNMARKQNVILVTDIGVAPGMSNVILGYHNARMNVESYKCLVGGLPVKREWPLEYKAAWSPKDVIEEYTRPARFRQNGKLVTRPALSDLELVNLDPVGTLEEWNSDGLRSLLQTMPDIPDMIEKTLRYPGTVDYLKALRELGYFSEEEIEVEGNKIKPVDLSAELLFRNWKRENNEKEFTIMQVVIEGTEKEQKVRYVYDLYDEWDEKTQTLSMARTTGYTCTAAAELVLKNSYNKKGVSPPEFLGENEADFNFIMDYLKERGVIYNLKKENL
jgi:saccharopine dehydrogenase-like NADP-dependent oxidoreductase